MTASLGLACFTAAYAVITDYRLLLALVLVHGIVWSSLLVASAAYLTSILPPARRGEGIAYWGLASVLAVAMAPSIGFWVYSHGWVWLCAGTTALNLMMAAIAWSMEDDRTSGHTHGAFDVKHAIEWRVVALSTPLFLYTYSYGAVSSFSAYYPTELDIHPGVYLTTMALVTLLSGRLPDAGDRIHRASLLDWPPRPGWWCRPSPTRGGLIAAAALFALGFGTAYPAFAAWVMLDIHDSRRAAAFGAILAAYDTGIGSGSTITGWLIGRWGFSLAFGVAAVLAALALPTFLLVERRFGHSPWKPEPETTPPPGDPLYAPAPFEE